jgi:hypothetical protein
MNLSDRCSGIILTSEQYETSCQHHPCSKSLLSCIVITQHNHCNLTVNYCSYNWLKLRCSQMHQVLSIATFSNPAKLISSIWINICNNIILKHVRNCERSDLLFGNWTHNYFQIPFSTSVDLAVVLPSDPEDPEDDGEYDEYC